MLATIQRTWYRGVERTLSERIDICRLWRDFLEGVPKMFPCAYVRGKKNIQNLGILVYLLFHYRNARKAKLLNAEFIDIDTIYNLYQNNLSKSRSVYYR